MVNTRSRAVGGLLHRARQAAFDWLMRNENQHDQITTRFVVLAWVGIVGMPAYYLIWSIWSPQAYENLALRLVGVALCLPVVAAPGWLRGRPLKLYLLVAVTYMLPFFFTFMYLMNHGSAVWTESLLVALIVLFHFQTVWAITSFLLGTLVACLAFVAVGEPGFLASWGMLEQLPIYAFAILVMSIAKLGQDGLAQEKKLAGLAQGLATVSHELRTPLASIDASARGIDRVLSRAQPPRAADWNATCDAIARIQYEVRHMHHMIDLFLMSATAVHQNLRPTEHVSMGSVVDAVIARYPFGAQSQRDMVAVEVRGEFNFAGQHELCVVILLNLLRNALKALHRAGKGRIRIVVDGERATPRLLFIDTGCGIERRHLPLIFQRFYSYPANAGSGIGLALCKEIMEAWQASIRCVSRELAYTIFILEFPASPHPHARTEQLAPPARGRS